MSNHLSKNEQIAKLIREVEATSEATDPDEQYVLITTSYMLELFEDTGFQNFLNMYGYAAKLHREDKHGASYYHISKDSNRLNEDCPDEEL